MMSLALSGPVRAALVKPPALPLSVPLRVLNGDCDWPLPFETLLLSTYQTRFVRFSVTVTGPFVAGPVDGAYCGMLGTVPVLLVAV